MLHDPYETSVRENSLVVSFRLLLFHLQTRELFSASEKTLSVLSGSLLSGHRGPPPPPPAAASASAREAPGAGIFDGVHSIPGDLVDLLTRNGTFAFLEDLHETGPLWDLRIFRIPTGPPWHGKQGFRG
jgi:hypothetical protein